MVFMSIFNFLEPALTIIAQTIPMFRVLFIRHKWDSRVTIRLDSVTAGIGLTDDKSNP